MDSSDVVKGTAAEATAFNLLRDDVEIIHAAASFHADYVQFEDEVRFEGDPNFRAWKDGGTGNIHIELAEDNHIWWDVATSEIRMMIAATACLALTGGGDLYIRGTLNENWSP